ncbi:MAG: hypothetical protein JXL81_00385 [Deltaproteobacteria bacterium]|nr:hypothetical protein [Deltaproteobacteria bacterium]
MLEETEKIKKGLLAVFPNQESFREFIDDNRMKADRFIDIAREYKIIGPNEGERAFEFFILENTVSEDDCVPPDDLNLGELLEDKDKIKNSVRGLTGWINDLVEKFNLGSLIPSGKVSNVMLSRLQREPANTVNKRNCLRLLAFWFGYSRGDLGEKWNYETLVKMCPVDIGSRSKRGVRIAFDLYSRGDVIESSSVNWLKAELLRCIKDLSLTNRNRFHSFSTTSFFLDIPNDNMSEESIDHPRSYGKAIKDALSIAHQISVRWSLSRHSTLRRRLTIAIAAGELSSLDIYLQSIIRTKLSADSVIRLTDFAHLCVLVNDIRTVFCEKPKEIEISTGEAVSIWWVMGLWNTNFWDLIPGLLEDPVLQMDDKTDQKFMKMLWFDDVGSESTGEKGANSVASFLKTPQDSFLGLEIARTLYFRRRFLAADEILRIILSADPSNLPARNLRMEIYWILGIEARSYSISDIHFRRAEKEAAFIDEICTTKIEDFFCEYGLGKMGHAITILRRVRQGRGVYREKEFTLGPDDVFRILDEAQGLFEMGMSLSSRGHRSYYFLLFTLSLKRILNAYNEIFTDPEIPITDRDGHVNSTAKDVFYAIGWLNKDKNIEEQYSDFVNFLGNAVSNYGESILLSTSIPNTRYSFASILWDFSPILTIGIAKTVLKFMYEAKRMTLALNDKSLCLFSTVRCHRDIMLPDVFLACVEKTIRNIEGKLGTIEQLSKLKNDEIIDPERLGGLKLFCLNI